MLIGEESKKYLKLVNVKAKMYEYSIPIEEHIAVDKDVDELFLSTIGAIGDYCYAIIENDVKYIEEIKENLSMAANFFEEYINGKFNFNLDSYLKLISSAAYYMIKRIGNSIVLLKDIDRNEDLGGNGLESLLIMILTNDFKIDINVTCKTDNYKFIETYLYLYKRFIEIGEFSEFYKEILQCRKKIYNMGNVRELLLIDIITAITKMKIDNSTVVLLPKFTGLSFNEWRETITDEEFIKELWPSQVQLGENGVFNGKSAVIQMPTGSGKTKSIEIIIQSSFLEKRTKFAVIVAPFRALCRQITMDLKKSFSKDKGILVNELNDILINDYNIDEDENKRILIVTPEKLMYLIKHNPQIIQQIGLIIFDEGHMFDDINRGVTYELLVTTIKTHLREDTQKILISAVIPNGEKMNEWFNDNNGVNISDSTSLITEKNIGFIDNTLKSRDKYSIYFLNKENLNSDNYFVPRVVTKIKLNNRPRERNEKTFPENKIRNKDIAISLADRLCSNGGIVIFCGRKDTAKSIVERILDISERGYDISNFINECNREEVERIHKLSIENLGKDNIYSNGIKNGVFSHHGNIPEGIKSATEYAMRKGNISTIICTSTLAQGVNLPIRYIIIPSIYQAGEEIQVRDFNNLVGRAGRSGMYTQGNILFTEPEVYRRKDWKWSKYVYLLDNKNSKPCESKILELSDFKNKYNDFINIYLSGDIDEYAKNVEEMMDKSDRTEKEKREIRYEIGSMIKILREIENFLISNMDTDEEGEFIVNEDIIKNSYAYFLARDEEKVFLYEVMEKLKCKITSEITDIRRLKTFAKTLLDLDKLIYLEKWIQENISLLENISDELELAKVIFPVIQNIIITREFEKINDVNKLVGVYLQWINGNSYYEILNYCKENNIKIRSRTKYKDLSIYNIISCCDDIMGYKASIVISAMCDIVREIEIDNENIINYFETLSRRTRYGLADEQDVIIYESGFNDRCLAKRMSEAIPVYIKSKKQLKATFKVFKVNMIDLLKEYPEVFMDIFLKQYS